MAAGKSAAGKTAAATQGGKNSKQVRTEHLFLSRTTFSAVLVSPDSLIVSRKSPHCLAVIGAVSTLISMTVLHVD